MIVTVTLNPALDVILKVNNLKINQYNKVLDACINLWWQRHKCIQSGQGMWQGNYSYLILQLTIITRGKISGDNNLN